MGSISRSAQAQLEDKRSRLDQCRNEGWAEEARSGAARGFVKQSDIAKTAKNPPTEPSAPHVSFFDRGIRSRHSPLASLRSGDVPPAPAIGGL